MKKYPTAIEITHLWLKLVAAEPSLKGPELIDIIVKPVASFNTEAISQELTQLIKKLKFIPSPLIISFPRNLVTMRNLHLPSNDPKEIAGMVDLHMAKQVPYPREEIIGGYQILGPDDAGYTRVILAIVHREALKQIFDALNSASLFPEKVELSSQGALSWFLFNQKASLAQGEIYILLDIDFNFTDFTIVNKDNLFFSRTIACGAEQIANEEIRRTKFISEAKQSLVIFQSEEVNRKPAKIFVSGAVDNIEDLAALLEKELNSKVEVVKLPLNTMTQVPKNVSISGVAGLSIEPYRKRINFMLPEIQIRRALKERSKEILMLGSLLVSILMLSCGIFLERVYNRTGYLRLLGERFGELRKNVEELDAMAKKTKLIRERLDSRFLSLDYLYQLHKIVPLEITIKMITFEADQKITLRGQALAMSDVYKFNSALEGSSYFKDIQIKFQTKKRIQERDISEFEIVCPMIK